MNWNILGINQKCIAPKRKGIMSATMQKKMYHQSPLILTKLFQHNLINVSYLTACYLYRFMMTLHFLNDIANQAEPTQKSKFMS